MGAKGGSGGSGSASLVLGITSIPAAVASAPLGLIVGIAALVLGLMGRSQLKRGLASNGAAAFAGTLTGVVGTALAAVYFVVAASFVYHHRNSITSFDRCFSHATTPGQVATCRQQLRRQIRSGATQGRPAG